MTIEQAKKKALSLSIYDCPIFNHTITTVSLHNPKAKNSDLEFISPFTKGNQLVSLLLLPISLKRKLI